MEAWRELIVVQYISGNTKRCLCYS